MRKPLEQENPKGRLDVLAHAICKRSLLQFEQDLQVPGLWEVFGPTIEKRIREVVPCVSFPTNLFPDGGQR